MVKTVEISMDSFNELLDNIKQKIQQAIDWLDNFFKTADEFELGAVGAIALGFILFIVGIIII